MKLNEQELKLQAAKNIAKRLWKHLNPTPLDDYDEDSRVDAYIDIEIQEEAARLKNKTSKKE